VADIEGAWVPRTEAEAEFITALSRLAAGAHEDGVAQRDIAAGLSFMAASVAAQDPAAVELDQPPEPPAGDGKREDCPECGATIEAVFVAMGGPAYVQPCEHAVPLVAVDGWVDTPGDDGA
jgi:hypothetical protein